MRFNINSYVHVRLTDVGRFILLSRYADKWHDAKGHLPPYRPPEEDADGWSKWQLWEPMKEFGPHVDNGRDVPFETEIEILS